MPSALGTNVAQGTLSYSRRLPALDDFYLETNFSLWKSTLSTKDLKTKLRTFPWFSWGSPIKI